MPCGRRGAMKAGARRHGVANGGVTVGGSTMGLEDLRCLFKIKCKVLSTVNVDFPWWVWLFHGPWWIN